MVFKTRVSINECSTVMNQYMSSSPDDVPHGVLVKKQLKIEDYVKNVQSILKEAKDHGVNVGDNQSKPTNSQRRWMA